MNTPALALAAPEVLPPVLLLTGDRQHTAQSILEAWRAGKSPATMRSYESDLEKFAWFLSDGLRITPTLTIDAALDRLFREDSASAHGLVLSFRRQCVFGCRSLSRSAPATATRQTKPY